MPKCDERKDSSQRHYRESGAGTCTACRSRTQKEAEDLTCKMDSSHRQMQDLHWFHVVYYNKIKET
ncbi:hypothetical protein IRJ41_017334 [Triplophysa rosa]|uniref:Uncharacterized protein n=1 Tax=Triplophysa rosa TaxID=992332 RepID=A0A9W7TN33_TRIRA|nr:hypothetical protein IRJ41_017334 [Triplophysa rosa]